MATITAIDQNIKLDGEVKHVTITLDTDHPEIVRMIRRAASAKGRKSVEAGGALVARVEAAEVLNAS